MKYRVLIHQPTEDNFTASVLELPAITVQGKTEEEVLSGTRTALSNYLSRSKVVTVEMETQPKYKNDLMKHFGCLRDDPNFDELMEEIQRYRREVDELEATKELLEEAA